MRPRIITLDEETLKGELKGLMRKTVEEAVGGILDAQADETADAERYERTDERQAYRSDHYKRGLLAQAGKIEAGAPKLRGARLAAEAVGRRRGREGPAGEALTETRLPGAPAGGVEDVTKILWDEGVSAGTASIATAVLSFAPYVFLVVFDEPSLAIRALRAHHRGIRKGGQIRVSKVPATSELIAGKWGNGAVRKSALEKAGYDYAAVQKRVNELLK